MEEIGLIREIEGECYPELRTVISENPIPHKARILRYMKRATKIAVTSGNAKDILTGETIPGTWSCQSDGEYSWRSDIVYYFEKYNLQLPDAFIRKVLSQNFQ